MRFLRLAFVVAVCCLATASCRVIYKQDVNQGNLLEQKMVDSLKPGMTRRQVSLILGTPSISSPFDQDRWSYTSSFSKRGRKAEIKTLTLIFEDNLLARIEGDYFPQRDAELLEDSKRYYPGRKIPMSSEVERKDRG
jgi:outer membrane protein assembly factor BamE